jgi:hypothetical protein
MNWIKISLMIIFMFVIFFTVLALPSCAALGLSRGTTETQPIIPSSPAAQMWKVVAKTNWVVTVCLLMFAAGLFTFFNGKPQLGLAIVFSSVGTLFFGLAVHRFPTWMAVGGLIASIAGVAATIIMRHRAIIEIIKGGQAFKKQIEEKDLGAVTLTESEANTVKKQFTEKQVGKQSPTTQKLVKQVKSKLKLKGEI